MADSIIKPSASGTTILKEEGGATALTIDASGNIQIANSITAGKLGKNVTVPQATTKRISRYNSRVKTVQDVSAPAGNKFMFGIWKPIDPVNNSVWFEMATAGAGAGQDHSSFGINFVPFNGGSDVNTSGKGVGYVDVNAPDSGHTCFIQWCYLAPNSFTANKEYAVWMRTNTASSNPRFFNPDAENDARLRTPTEASLVIYEYKNI